MNIEDAHRMLIGLSEHGLRFHPPRRHRSPPGSAAGARKGYYPPHGHDQLEFICLVEGAVELYVNGRWMPCRLPQPRVFMPGAVHGERRIDKRTAYRMLWGTLFPSTFIFHITSYHALTGYATSSSRLAVAPPMVALTWEISQRPGFQLAVKDRALFHAGLMECLLFTVGNPDLFVQQSAVAHDRIVEQVKDYVLRNYAADISLARIASMMHYSPGHLNVLFRRVEHISLHRFINEIRLRQAYRLLHDEKVLVKQAALAVGFRDPLYFSRLFRRRFGRHPSKIRQQSSGTGSPDRRRHRNPVGDQRAARFSGSRSQDTIDVGGQTGD